MYDLVKGHTLNKANLCSSFHTACQQDASPEVEIDTEKCVCVGGGEWSNKGYTMKPCNNNYVLVCMCACMQRIEALLSMCLQCFALP